MIVYGDPQSVESFNLQVERLRDCLHHLLGQSRPSPDKVRAALVRAGQLEQAVFDAQPTLDASTLQHIHTVTNAIANAFVSAASRNHSEIRAFINEGLQALEQVTVTSQVVSVKIPEGFAFYTLFPEQYALAAKHWAQSHKDDEQRKVVVVGIRSIGTTSAAVVKTTFQREGWQAVSFTVRPTGHPFERVVELPAKDLDPDCWCIIADEGPGMSGSSFVAAAEAMVKAGIQRERIGFLSGHGGMPGGAASESVLEWWQTTPRYFVPLDQIPFNTNGDSLIDVLEDETESLLDSPAAAPTQDLGGGLWRHAVYASPDEMPPVCIPFERSKYLVTLANGQRVLWKFAGFAAAPESPLSLAEVELQQFGKRHRAGDSPEPLGYLNGFVAQKWIEGKRLTREDVTSELLAHVGSYIARTAGAALTQQEQEKSLARLHEMLYWNTWELLGEAEAEKTRQWSHIRTPPQRYGDGRLMPHEWVMTTHGKIIKTDGSGHDLDHTVVGRQSVLWDVAGAIVEWNVRHETASPLLNAVQSILGERFEPNSLQFYRAAYAAFRGGICALCALSAEQQEQRRLWQAVEYYKQALSQVL